MQIYRLAALSDNYIFLLFDPATQTAAVVDPAEPEPVLTALQRLQAKLVAIFNTHHHGDHVGANLALRSQFPDLEIYASRADVGRIPGQTVELSAGDRVTFAGQTADVFFVPGHTRGHIAYYFPPQPEARVSTTGTASAQDSTQDSDQVDRLDQSIAIDASDRALNLPSDLLQSGVSTSADWGELFCGDTLFAGGCGRLFEGTPAQMLASLSQLRQLPDRTRVWCAHEYTEGNLKFAVTIEPENSALLARVEQVRQARSQAQATIPTDLGTEKATNPFLRWDQPTVQATIGQTAPERVFAQLRGRKDLF